jgi:hypothetical protein
MVACNCINLTDQCIIIAHFDMPSKCSGRASRAARPHAMRIRPANIAIGEQRHSHSALPMRCGQSRSGAHRGQALSRGHPLLPA